MKKQMSLFLTLLGINSCIFAQQGGYALHFNGTDNEMELPVASPFSFPGNAVFTFETWIYYTGTNIQSDLFAKRASEGEAEYAFYIDSTNNHKLYFKIGKQSVAWQEVAVSNSPVPKNSWTHVAVVKTATNAYIYMNGVLEGTGTLDYNSQSATGCNTFPVKIGSDNFAPAFAGKIDEVRFWNTANTMDQIRENMFKELTGNESGLIAYYKMSEGNGTIVHDATANNYDATLTDPPVWEFSGCLAGPRKALQFNENNERMVLPLSEAFAFPGNSVFTFETWIYYTGTTTQVDLFAKRVESGQAEYVLLIFGNINDKLYFRIGKQTTGGWQNVVISNSSIPRNCWTHVAVVKTATNACIYLNGRLDASGTLNAMLLTATGNVNRNIEIGSNNYAHSFAGKMDEIRFWSSACTTNQIRENMMKSLTGNETDLIAYYRMDENGGNKAYDISPNALHAILYNMDTNTVHVNSTAFNTWIGCSGTVWSDASNWSLGTVPNSFDNVGLYKWAPEIFTVITHLQTVNSLLISRNSDFLLNTGITVNGNLLLERDVNLNSTTVTLGPKANLVEGDGFFYGTSGMITTTRNLSNISGEDIAGLGAAITTSADLGITTINRKHHTALTIGENNKSILRYFDIIPANNLNLNATLKLNYRNSELQNNQEAMLKLYKTTNNGINWSCQYGVADTINNTVTLSGINSFSGWTASSHYFFEETYILCDTLPLSCHGNTYTETTVDTIHFNSITNCDSAYKVTVFFNNPDKDGYSFTLTCASIDTTIPFGTKKIAIPDIGIPVINHFISNISDSVRLTKNIPDYYFPGTTEVIWTAIDTCGNTITGTQTIRVHYPPCGDTVKAVDYDNNSYESVLIGSYCWTKENLKSTHYANGDSIAFAKGYYSLEYSNVNQNIENFGRLYSWYSVVKIPENSTVSPAVNAYNHIRGVCPNGWYLPFDSHFVELNAYGSEALKSTTLWLNFQNGTNTTAFTLYPAGIYNATGGFVYLFGNAFCWTSTSEDSKTAHSVELKCNCPELIFGIKNKANGYSVRCVKE